MYMAVSFRTPNCPASDMGPVVAPVSEAEVADLVAEAAGNGNRLAIEGNGSMRETGVPHDFGRLSLARLDEIVNYDPSELVLTVRPGALLSDVEILLRQQQQMLAFEPFEIASMPDGRAGRSTMGGIAADGRSGPRRVSAGGARDHMLGIRAVSGRGEVFVAGGKVVKNVTGYDLPKLAAGSRGRLFAITEITFKVLPQPENAVSLVLSGLAVTHALQAMTAAFRTGAGVAAAAHLPAEGGNPARTLIRLEGFASAMPSAIDRIRRTLAAIGKAEVVASDHAGSCWTAVREAPALRHCKRLWRINIPPRNCAHVTQLLERSGTRFLLDWGGGLVQAGWEGNPAVLRSRVAEAGGHALLLRASPEDRASIPMLHPQPAPLARLEERVRRAFDPHGVFEIGRF